MNCKLITENDCAVSAVLSCSPVEFLIINKAIARCSDSTDYAEADRRTMVLMSEAMKNFEQVEVAETPQTDECEGCKHYVYQLGCTHHATCEYEPKEPQTDCDTCRHYKLACDLFSEVCKYEPKADTPQTESTGSPIGDYRDGVGAWDTDCGWK